MKKILALALVLLMALTAAACGQKANAPEATPTQSPSEAPASEAPATAAPDGTPSDGEDEPEYDGTWPTLYNIYASRDEGIYSMFTAAVEEQPLLALNILNVIAGDISLAFTATFGSENPASSIEATFSLMGFTDCSYVENGSTYTLTCKDSEGEECIIELKFDAASRTAEYTQFSGGKLAEQLSLLVTDDVVAKQYYSVGEESSNLVCLLGRTNGDCFLSFGEVDSAPTAGLYKNAAYASGDFAQNLGTSMSVVNGKLAVK